MANVVEAGSIVCERMYCIYTQDQQSLEKRKADSQQTMWLADLADLKNINMHVATGEKVAVVGTDKASVSMLLLSLCNELEVLQGSLRVGGRVSYISRQLYFVEDTVKQNIVLGLPFDDARYGEAIGRSGLKHLLQGSQSIEETVMV